MTIKPFLSANVKTNFSFMLSEGADLHAADSHGWNALHYASQCGCMPMISYLLSQGIDIKKKTHRGVTALMIAMDYEKEAAVDFLFAEGRYNNHYTHTL